MKMKRLFDYQENIDVVGGGIKKWIIETANATASM